MAELVRKYYYQKRWVEIMMVKLCILAEVQVANFNKRKLLVLSPNAFAVKCYGVLADTENSRNLRRLVAALDQTKDLHLSTT